ATKLERERTPLRSAGEPSRRGRSSSGRPEGRRVGDWSPRAARTSRARSALRRARAMQAAALRTLRRGGVISHGRRTTAQHTLAGMAGAAWLRGSAIGHAQPAHRERYTLTGIGGVPPLGVDGGVGGGTGSGGLSHSVLETRRAHLPVSAVRDMWVKRLRDDTGERVAKTVRLGMVQPGDAQAIDFACEMVGSGIWQLVLDCASPPAKSNLLRVLAPASLTLAENVYGSYVLRACLTASSTPAETAALIRPLISKVGTLARLEFGAHVVLAALTRGGPRERTAIIQRLLEHSDSDRPAGAEAGAEAGTQPAPAPGQSAADFESERAIRVLCSLARQTHSLLLTPGKSGSSSAPGLSGQAHCAPTAPQEPAPARGPSPSSPAPSPSSPALSPSSPAPAPSPPAPSPSSPSPSFSSPEPSPSPLALFPGLPGSLLRTLAHETHGSLIVQQLLELAPPRQRSIALSAIMPDVLSLALSPAGSFVVVTALSVGSAVERAKWVQLLLPHADELVQSKAGVRALHAAAEVSDVADEALAKSTGRPTRAQLELAMRRLRDGACPGSWLRIPGLGRASPIAESESAPPYPAAGFSELSPSGSDSLVFNALDASGRRRVHAIARKLGLDSKSVGGNEGERESRRLIVRRRPLPPLEADVIMAVLFRIAD
ncbi:hypothetical protein T492DRAFT_1058879, partial [Pavlovales sp. CCMP2436]